MRRAAREPADRELRDRGGGRVTDARPRVAVVTFPARTTTATRLALELLGAEARAGLAHADGAAAGNGRRRPARGLLVRRLPALRRHRPRRAGDGRRPPVRRRRRTGARDLQRLPDPVRGGAAARRAPAEPAPRVHLRRRHRHRRVASDAFTASSRSADELVIPIKHGEGMLGRRRRALPRGRGRRGQIVLRYAHDVNGSRERVAGVATRPATSSA